MFTSFPSYSRSVRLIPSVLGLCLSLTACGDDDGGGDAATDASLADGQTADTSTRDSATDGAAEDTNAEDSAVADGGDDGGTDTGPADSGVDLCGDRTVPMVALEEVGRFNQPVFVTAAPDDPDRLYVVEKTGRIRIVEGGETLDTPFLEVDGLATSGEQGLLGLAFHPNYADNGRFFVFNTPSGPRRNTVDEYHRSDADPRVADDAMVARLATIEDEFSNHNGGTVLFGPDGFLYAGYGDEGSGGDPNDNGLDLTNIFSAVIRLDVDNAAENYVAAGNPFIDGPPGADPRIWAYGLRNPWRMSFDRLTGDLYIGDVGQNRFEEIDVLTPEDGGANLGWAAYEAFEVFEPMKVDEVPVHHEPTLAYRQNDFDEVSIRGGVSVTGGYVYRGSAIPELQGFYLFGDYQSRDVAAFTFCGGEATNVQRMPDLEVPALVSFGEDGHGELYMVSINGPVHRILPTP